MIIPKVCVPLRTCKVAMSHSSHDVANKKTTIHHKSPIAHHPSPIIIIVIIIAILAQVVLCSWLPKFPDVAVVPFTMVLDSR